MLYQSLAGRDRQCPPPAPATCTRRSPAACDLGGLGEPLAAQFGRQAEVEEYDPALRRHQHVRRLDVAVQLARLVHRRDPLGELQEGVPEAPSPGRREWCGRPGRLTIGSATTASEAPADIGLRRHQAGPSPVVAGRAGIVPYVPQEVGPIDQLHDDEPTTAVEDQLIQPHEVDVDDLQEAAKLLLEPEDCPRALVPNGLQRDLRAAIPVERAVDHSHPAAAEQAEDLVAGHVGPVLSGDPLDLAPPPRPHRQFPVRNRAGAGPTRNARWTSNCSATSRARPGNRRTYSSARGDSPSSSRSATSLKIRARTDSGSSRSDGCPSRYSSTGFASRPLNRRPCSASSSSIATSTPPDFLGLIMSSPGDYFAK